MAQFVPLNPTGTIIWKEWRIDFFIKAEYFTAQRASGLAMKLGCWGYVKNL
jgi:hypothetical protein